MLARWSVVALMAPFAMVSASAQRQPGTYTYVQTSEQMLADGTHITSTTHSVIIRDAEGRTRNENETQMPGRPVVISVSISDPVAGVSYFFEKGDGDSASHTYTRVEREDDELQSHVIIQSTPYTTQSASIVTKPQSSGVGIAASTGGVGRGLLSVATTKNATELRPEIKGETVGFDSAQGISCRLDRQTITYPVNFFGNDRPMVATRETCTSVENAMIVRNVSKDPRTGTYTMVLESVSFAEPAATLFQPPPDYTENTPNRTH